MRTIHKRRREYAHIQGITDSETLNKAFSEGHNTFEASKDYNQ
jgi:hypothetical protein